MCIRCWSGNTLPTSSSLEALMQLPSPLLSWDSCAWSPLLSCLQYKMYFSSPNKTLGLTKRAKLGQQMAKRCLRVWSSSAASKEKHTVAISSFPTWKGNFHSGLQLYHSHTWLLGSPILKLQGRCPKKYVTRSFFVHNAMNVLWRAIYTKLNRMITS